MNFERSVMAMTLLRLDYLVYYLDNCADDTPTKTDQWKCHKSVMVIKFANMYQ